MRGYLGATRGPLVGIAVTLPLLTLHNVGVLLAGNGNANAMDLLTGLVEQVFGLAVVRFVDAGLLLVTLIAVFWAFRKGALRWSWWGLLALEGAIYGLLMAILVHWALERVQVLDVGEQAGQVAEQVLVQAREGLEKGAAVARQGMEKGVEVAREGLDRGAAVAREGLQRGAVVAREVARMSASQVLITAAGAGFWEELVFRLLGVGLLMAIAGRIAPPSGGKRRLVLILVGLVAVAGSSFLFSSAHFWVAGQHWDPYAFWYRFGAGVVLSMVFLVRGFATAAWTHFIYDLVVMLLARGAVPGAGGA